MSNSLQSQRSPFALLSIVILLSMGTFLIAPTVFIQIGATLLGTNLQDFIFQLKNESPTSSFQYMLIMAQGLGTFLSFIVVPLIFIKLYENASSRTYFNAKNINPIGLIITCGLTLTLMIVNSPVIEWNQNLDFPQSISDIIDPFEEQGKIMTSYLIDFHSFGYFLSVLLVVSVIPAIGEEFLFRGLIQKYFHQITKNPHVAIWGAAIFFSAFHMQFYGFVPRMLLGAFFGYLFYFSGNLSYAIIGHFINNGFTLLMVYLFQKEVVKFDIESTESIPLLSVAVFLIIGIILFVLFRKQFHITDNLQNE